MSHRQKNKHKSRHRIHANNGPRIAQKGRAVTGPVAATPVVSTPVETTSTHSESTAVNTVSTENA